ncbi:hypothetical protein ID866_13209, partial [Astraeus odoratus]
MWDKVTLEEGSRREQELSNDILFKTLLSGGATMMRHTGSRESASTIINHLLRLNGTTAEIARELVDKKKGLGETAAGVELLKEYQAMLEKQNQEIAALHAELKAAKEAMAEAIKEETEKSKEAMAKVQKEIEMLRRGSTGLQRFMREDANLILTAHSSWSNVRDGMEMGISKASSKHTGTGLLAIFK